MAWKFKWFGWTTRAKPVSYILAKFNPVNSAGTGQSRHKWDSNISWPFNLKQIDCRSFCRSFCRTYVYNIEYTLYWFLKDKKVFKCWDFLLQTYNGQNENLKMIRAVKRSGLTTFCHKIKSSIRWILKGISTKNVWIFMIFTNRPEMVKNEGENRPERQKERADDFLS